MRSILLNNKRRFLYILLTALILLLFIWRVPISTYSEVDVKRTIAESPRLPDIEIGLNELPLEDMMHLMAENDQLQLFADSATGHFKIVDKRKGDVHYSYPNPEHWLDEQQKGNWRFHIRSPLIIEYMDFGIPNVKSKLTSFAAQLGEVEHFTAIEKGFSLKFKIANMGLSIPVEVTLESDYVQTRIKDDELIEEEPKLISLELYPFFGAAHSVAGQEDYILIPDGSGALIPFRDSQDVNNQMYEQRVYGVDYAFDTIQTSSSVKQITMPVYGMRTGDQGFMAVVDEGEAYSRIVASPAGVYSSYNWATVKQMYRDSFRMIPNQKKADEFFVTYNVEKRFGSDRTVRYYVFDSTENTYVGMGKKLREYLMQTYQITRQAANNKLQLRLSIVGAGTKKGRITNSILQQTTFSQSVQIMQRLNGLGIDRMAVTLHGWQHGGAGQYGGFFPIESDLGGRGALKDLVSYAHSLGFPVYLNVEYQYNNTGKGGFSARTQGMRDMSGTLLKHSGIQLVSNQFVLDSLQEDLGYYVELGVDGLEYQSMGRNLSSDFNSKYGADRVAIQHVQERIFELANSTLGSAAGTNVNRYALASIDHIQELPNDHSYYSFSQRSVPFIQIALHGLVSYSSKYINNYSEYEDDMLKDIEYGYHPSFVVTWEDTKLKYSTQYNNLFSTKYDDWESEIVVIYDRLDTALAAVQHLFIVDHLQHSDMVYETVYEDGHRIIVNYGEKPFVLDSYTVPARNFIGIQGGESR